MKFLILSLGMFATLKPIAYAAAADTGEAYTFSTLAGAASLGSADGVGGLARFNYPEGIAADTNGTLYVVDTDNHTIRMITPAGVVSTLAGLAGSPGSADGMGGDARFYYPYGIAVDGVGSLYVADTDNHTIRKITPVGTNWVVSTLAGLAGSFGSTDGTRRDARFRYPEAITVDSAGNLYVADTDNSTIRKITPVGTNWVVSTFAGSARSDGSDDGMGGNARFRRPEAIAVDRAGNLYVADTENDTIRKITANGVVSTLAGSAQDPAGSDDGQGNDARFDSPDGIAVDNAGNVYVAEADNYTIRKITPGGVVTTLAGSAGSDGSDDGTGSDARFNRPTGIALDRTGTLYVADSANHTIRNVTSAGVVNTFAGSAGSAGSTDGTGSDARFHEPRGIAIDSAGNLYVADLFNDTIRKITAAGVVSTLAGSAKDDHGSNDGTGSDARFHAPRGVAVDSAGNLYVADSVNSTIRKVTSAGVVSTLAGLAGSDGTNDGIGSAAQFNFPRGVAVDSARNVYVADTYNHTIRKITPARVVSTLAGLGGTPGTNDGPGGSARFNLPYGLAVDSAGDLYVGDTDNHTIRKVTSAGVVSTLAGLAGLGGSADGTGGEARFESPNGLAVDSAGNLYVADTDNYTIRKIMPFGAHWVVTTIAGSASDAGSDDGRGIRARFNLPWGIAVDSAGNLYVTDSQNNTIRKGAFRSYAPRNAVAYTPPARSGQFTVTLVPPEADGQWRFPWELGWRRSGVTASNLVPGNYEVEFRSLPGWLAIPPSLTVVVTNDGRTAITGQYYPTLNSGSGDGGAGTLIVNLGINPPDDAGWRFLGDATPFLRSGSTNLLPGTYLIEFASVNGRTKPPSQAVQVLSGLPAYVSVNYLLATTPSGNFNLPVPVPTNQINDLTNYPFGFNGQLQSDTGYGSGVAVEANVVLTAAHLVFNGQSLTYVRQAYWFFQREADVFEPQPQAARGWYVLSGYAAQRTNDLESGYSPDQSTPPSRNADVAALYFLRPVAGGGHGGYLPSDSVPNPWLTGNSLKMLVGYPVDGSQFGVGIVPGRMYQTEPQPYPLTLATDPVPGQQQVYIAPWFLSYPGNSGGPVYVQLNGYYYPAGVYLGTLFSGAQPYASVVRAIDSSVTNLIRLAAKQGDSGTNFTGGGVITIIPSQAISSRNPGYVQFQLRPPAAVRAGAGWRLQGDTVFSSAANYTRAVTSTNSFGVEFNEIAGWKAPTNQNVTVLPGQLTPYTAFYTVTNPVWVQRAAGFGITGTTGTTYRVERRSLLMSGAWLPVSTNTISSTGFNLVLPKPPTNPPTTFYRLLWLPE
jgi:sugar lactone lactonase YvrE